VAERRAWRTCRFCLVDQPIDFDTDGMGRLVELPLRCGCAVTIMRLDGGRRCADCPSSVQGRYLRCELCRSKRITHKHAQYAKTWRQRHPVQYAKMQAAQDARRRDERAGPNGDKVRAQDRRPSRVAQRNKARRAREQAFTPKERATRNAVKRAWARSHPEQVKRSQDRANALRATAKRAYMHDYATKHVGKAGLAVKCRKCGTTIAYAGRGRPRMDCMTCRKAA